MKFIFIEQSITQIAIESKTTELEENISQVYREEKYF